MKKNLDYFRERKAEAEKDIAKWAADLEKLNRQRDELEMEIANAIDAEDQSKVERLTAKETELDIKIKSAERIIDRKREKATDKRDELMETNNAEMQEYQKKIDTAMTEAGELRKKYILKLLEAANIAKAGRDTRMEYLKLAGDEAPHQYTHANKDFATVRTAIYHAFTGDDVTELRKVQDNAMQIIGVFRPYR